MEEYTSKDIKISLKKLNIKKNDNLFIHSNLTLFGNCRSIKNIFDLPKLWSKEILNCVGKKSTIIFPLFTLSSCRKEIFDPIKSKSNCGILNEFLFKNYKCVRTNDPIYSFGIIGKKKNEINKLIDIKNSFSNKSIFEYIKKNNFKILCLNHNGTTFLHYIERKFKVNYRFDKEFEGKIKIKGKIKKINSKIYVAYKSDSKIQHCPKKFSSDARREKLIKNIKLGSGNIDVMYAKKVYSFVRKKIKINHYYLTKNSNKKNLKINILKEKIYEAFNA
jgi:aminoglycoside 3-N-acetyltransferase